MNWADPLTENYLSQQLITYIGNKRTLLGFVKEGLQIVQGKLGRSQLSILDAFTGSGVVARFFKAFSSKLVVNDLELYSRVISQCYLANLPEVPLDRLKEEHRWLVNTLESKPLIEGWLSKHYAPQIDHEIAPGERVFYSSRNARYLDTARQLIGELPPEDQCFFLGPLLSEASIHANTGGVFKGFYKNHSGVGAFGGQSREALNRILGPISLPFPLFSPHSCPVEVHQRDIVDLAKELEPLDLAYLDPPYNQHPYGSNYFMLNLLAHYKEPQAVSQVSGIPQDWNRSVFNKKAQAAPTLEHLVQSIPARFLLISFNSEGFISRAEMEEILNRHGQLETLEITYNTFRASRNLKDRNLHVKEFLYLLDKRSVVEGGS